MTAVIFSIIIILAVMGTALTRDNITQITHIQYSSKQGRKTLHKQLIAMIFSSFLITALQFAVVAPPLLKELKPFLNCDWSSAYMMYNTLLWFRGTIGQYLIPITLFVFAVTIAFTLVFYFLSKNSTSYIPLLIKGIIGTAVFGFIGYIA